MSNHRQLCHLWANRASPSGRLAMRHLLTLWRRLTERRRPLPARLLAAHILHVTHTGSALR